MRPRTAILLLLAVGFGLFAYLRPHQVQEVWHRLNDTLFATFGSNPAEYEGPKTYFYATDTLVRGIGKEQEITLTDGSRWSLLDPSAMAGWSVGQTVRIHQTEDKKFPYVIANSELNHSFPAKFLGKE